MYEIHEQWEKIGVNNNSFFAILRLDVFFTRTRELLQYYNIIETFRSSVPFLDTKNKNNISRLSVIVEN